jgi:hypothetical protein
LQKQRNFCPELQSAGKLFVALLNFSTLISRWAQGQPDNANGKENCLALELSGQGYMHSRTKIAIPVTDTSAWPWTPVEVQLAGGKCKWNVQ